MGKLKVIIACLVCIVMIVSTKTVSASSCGNNSDDMRMDEHQQIIECAKKWIQMSKPNQGIDRINVEKIYNISSKSDDYVVSCYADNIDYGYVIIGFDNGNACVMEAVVDKEIKGVREKLDEVIDNLDLDNYKDYNVKSGLVEIAPLRYGIIVKKDNNDSEEIVVDNMGQVLQGIDYGSSSFGDVSDVMIDSMPSDKYKVDQTSVRWLPKFAKRHKLFPLTETAVATGLYACGPQALLQISYMEGLYLSDKTFDSNRIAFLMREYDSLWKKTNTKYTGEIGEIGLIKYKLGEGSTNDAVKGYANYVKTKKCTLNATTEISPQIDNIKNGLKTNKSMLMGYGIIDKDGKRKGHFVSILGYKEAVEISSGNKYSYLAVADGWNENVAYINFKYAKEFKDYQVAYFNIIH